MDDHFTLEVEEITIEPFYGFGLELYGTYTAEFDGEGNLCSVSCPGWTLKDPGWPSHPHYTLFRAFAVAIEKSAAVRIEEMVNETPYRVRERAADRAAEMAMGK